MKKKFMKLTAIAVAASMVTGMWMTGGGTVLAETAGTETDSQSEIETLDTEDNEGDDHESGNSESSVVFAGGDGSEENPYQVATAEQLDAVRNDLSAYYIQTTDIDLTGIEWEPIGGQLFNEDERRIFTGSYDGNGYEIQNMSITSTGYLYAGLFGLSTGTISGVHLINCNISISLDYSEDDNVCIGGIAGGNRLNSTKGNINNCSVEGQIYLCNAYRAFVGGIVGAGGCSDSINFSTINVESISNTDYDFMGSIMCGGIVGYSGTINTSISKCINYGDITASASSFLYCGGISGEYGAIEYCVNYGAISGRIIEYQGWSSFASNCNVGGIVGATSSDTNKNSVNFGSVSSKVDSEGGSCSAGGYAGFIGYYSSGKISECYNLCDTIEYTANTTTRGSHAGRVAGYLVPNRASDCYSYDKTLINGEIPTENIGSDQINGASLSWDEINEAVEPILSALGIDTGTSGDFSLEDDVWSFSNSNVYFGDLSEGYYITSSDYNRLISQLDNIQTNLVSCYVSPDSVQKRLSENLTELFPWSSDNISGNILDEMLGKLNLINHYNIDGESSNVEEWGGSCYGMSVWVILNNANVLDASDIDGTSSLLSEFSLSPNENNDVESAINYYHHQQHLTALKNAYVEFMEKTQIEQVFEIEEMVDDISEGGNLVLLWYNWYPEFNSDGTVDTDEFNGHMVVAYGHETGDFSDYVCENMKDGRSYCVEGYDFDNRIFIYDCANPDSGEAYDLYYSEDEGVWCIPGYGIVSKTSQSMDSEYNNGQITLATNDVSLLNAVDYNTGDPSSLVSESLQEENIYKSIISLNNTDYSIGWGTDSADISGITVYNNTSTEQIFVISDAGITSEGNSGSGETTAFLPESDQYSVTTEEDSLGFRFNQGNYLTTVIAASSGSVDFSTDGNTGLFTSDPTLYYISLVANEGYYTLPWHTIEIAGEQAAEVSTEITDDGIILSSDNLENVIISGTNDTESFEINISTDKNTVLITESDNNLVALVDNDNDGVYETDVNDITGHEHVYGSPEFIWSDDYASCTAVFTCEDGDDSQEVECVVTSADNSDGTVTYTATVEFNGTTYTDTRSSDGTDGGSSGSGGDGSTDAGAGDDTTGGSSGDDGSSSVIPDDTDKGNPADEGTSDDGSGSAAGGESSISTDDGTTGNSDDTSRDGSSQASGSDDVDDQSSDSSSSASSGDSVQTGDDTDITIWVMLAAAAGTAMIIGIRKKRKIY